MILPSARIYISWPECCRRHRLCHCRNQIAPPAPLPPLVFQHSFDIMRELLGKVFGEICCWWSHVLGTGKKTTKIWWKWLNVLSKHTDITSLNKSFDVYLLFGKKKFLSTFVTPPDNENRKIIEERVSCEFNAKFSVADLKWEKRHQAATLLSCDWCRCLCDALAA